MPDATPLTDDELRRYARHLTLPEFGTAGQARLKQTGVLCIGAGGLGSPALLYLAAAGVGRIGIVDADVVEESNLQRQVIFGVEDLGQPKAEAAARRLRQVNPLITIEPHVTRFTRDNAENLLAPYDVLLDGTDNFPTRYLCNDVAFRLRKPNVHGAIQRFEGQLSVFAPHLGSPCYRCFFPEAPPPGTVPSCAEGGVLGILPGLVGALQATEAIKLLAGLGAPLLGRLLHVDALAMRFREITLRRNPDCALCGEHPTLTELPAGAETGPACDVAADGAPVPALAIADFAAWRDTGRPYVLLDVREPQELAICRLPEAVNIPLGQVEARAGEIRGLLSNGDASAPRPLVVHCKSGRRSAEAVTILQRHGVDTALSLTGGILAWAGERDPRMARY